MNVLHLVWRRLNEITHLHFKSESGSLSSKSGWNGTGDGFVQVDRQQKIITFKENGAWNTSEGKQLVFRNIFRWTYKQEEAVISLEHLRFGVSRPVFLFDLGMGQIDNQLVSVEPHICVEDTYTGRLDIQTDGFDLHWNIKGPRKNEHIHYQYR